MDTAAREEKQLCRRLRKNLLHLSIPTALLIVLSVCDGWASSPPCGRSWTCCAGP